MAVELEGVDDDGGMIKNEHGNLKVRGAVNVR
jgi:hypothetical protein